MAEPSYFNPNIQGSTYQNPDEFKAGMMRGLQTILGGLQKMQPGGMPELESKAFPEFFQKLQLMAREAEGRKATRNATMLGDGPNDQIWQETLANMQDDFISMMLPQTPQEVLVDKVLDFVVPGGTALGFIPPGKLDNILKLASSRKGNFAEDVAAAVAAGEITEEFGRKALMHGPDWLDSVMVRTQWNDVGKRTGKHSGPASLRPADVDVNLYARSGAGADMQGQGLYANTGEESPADYILGALRKGDVPFDEGRVGQLTIEAQYNVDAQRHLEGKTRFNYNEPPLSRERLARGHLSDEEEALMKEFEQFQREVKIEFGKLVDADPDLPAFTSVFETQPGTTIQNLGQRMDRTMTQAVLRELEEVGRKYIADGGNKAYGEALIKVGQKKVPNIGWSPLEIEDQLTKVLVQEDLPQIFPAPDAINAALKEAGVDAVTIATGQNSPGYAGFENVIALRPNVYHPDVGRGDIQIGREPIPEEFREHLTRNLDPDFDFRPPEDIAELQQELYQGLMARGGADYELDILFDDNTIADVDDHLYSLLRHAEESPKKRRAAKEALASFVEDFPSVADVLKAPGGGEIDIDTPTFDLLTDYFIKQRLEEAGSRTTGHQLSAIQHASPQLLAGQQKGVVPPETLDIDRLVAELKEAYAPQALGPDQNIPFTPHNRTRATAQSIEREIVQGLLAQGRGGEATENIVRIFDDLAGKGVLGQGMDLTKDITNAEHTTQILEALRDMTFSGTPEDDIALELQALFSQLGY